MEVYFDNSATTRCYDSVKDIVVKTMTEDFGNPSAMHLKGVEAEKYVKEATKTIAGILKVQEKERNSVYIRWYRIRQPCADWWCTCK